MLANEKGFTLIELIIVIVILGLLSAVAIPRYQDLRTDAAIAAADGVYGAAEGSCAVNFAARLVSPTRSTAITNVTTLIAAMDGGVVPSGWTISGGTLQDNTSTYQITVTSVTPATQASVPTARARANKNW